MVFKGKIGKGEVNMLKATIIVIVASFLIGIGATLFLQAFFTESAFWFEDIGLGFLVYSIPLLLIILGVGMLIVLAWMVDIRHYKKL